MIALVRSVPASYAAQATRAHYDPTSAIDPAATVAQHRGVARALARLGDDVHWLASPDDQPDAVFVEDTAVVVGGRALVARSAHPGRRGEAVAVAARLAALGLDVVSMDDGTLDGGDVLRVGTQLFVGRSTRTDATGVAWLARTFPALEVVPVELPAGVLHLKCVASTPGDEATVVLAEGTVPVDVFAGLRCIEVPADEAYAANLVGNGRRVVVAAGHPRTADLLDAAGFEVDPVPVDELRKGDGSLTCLSLRFEAASPVG